MFENPRRGRQASTFTTNVPKILDFKSSSEQIFSRKLTLGASETSSLFFQLLRFVKCWRFVSGVESQRTVSKFTKRKRKSYSVLCSRPHKTWNWEVSRRSRAETAKKCTKKRDARAKLLFCQFFCRFRWRRRRRCLSSLLWSRGGCLFERVELRGLFEEIRYLTWRRWC